MHREKLQQSRKIQEKNTKQSKTIEEKQMAKNRQKAGKMGETMKNKEIYLKPEKNK